MSTPETNLRPIPGLEVVGRGVYLQPHQPYQLRGILFKRQDISRFAAKDANGEYALPRGYAVNDSPPMPSNQALNHVVIEESWERFEKQSTLDANAAVSATAFSISATTIMKSHLRSSEEAFYALHSSFIPFWTVYIDDITLCTDEIEQMEIPFPFRHAHRRVYEAVFERFGSHYVRRAWVGGKAEFYFTVTKSSQLSKEDIQAGLKASYGPMGNSEAKGTSSEAAEKLRNVAQCSVFGSGGDELKLAALSTLDEGRYNDWLNTIRDNPQCIELEVMGIWTLLKDGDKARALMEAYKAATTFSRISAVFVVDRTIYCVRGRYFFTYDVETNKADKPRLLTELFPQLEALGFEQLDCVCNIKGMADPKGGIIGTKLLAFWEDRYVSLDVATHTVDEGYPRLLSEGFPGFPFDRVDATLVFGRHYLYFFRGNKYARYDIRQGRIEEGYPELISKRWVGVTFDRLDAAINWGNDKVYFFKEDQHIRYDMVMCQSDPGYPKTIVGNYVEDWKFFD